MFSSKVILLAFILVISSFCYDHPVNEDLIQEIKNSSLSWTPMEVDENQFAYWSVEEIKALLSSNFEDEYDSSEDEDIVSFEGDDEDYPENFDGRKEFGSLIHPTRNQKKCGACYAFAAATAYTDRYSIASKGEKNIIFSPQDMVSCSKQNRGCHGGFVKKAWQFIRQAGLVTDDCHPYTSGDTKVKGTCPKKCADGTAKVRHRCGQLHHASSTRGARGMIRDGPVSAAFKVYEDFMNYKSGIYQHTSGKLLGGHDVKIIGWGKENDIYYWLCANSWSPTWGEGGYFRIQMGQVGINNQMYAGNAILKSFEETEELVKEASEVLEITE